MKTALIILVIGVALALNIGIKHESAQKKQTPAASQTSIRTLRLGLAGITPANQADLSKLLRATPGVKSFRIDVRKKQARIDIDLQKTNVEDLFQSMRNIGITAWI